MRDPRDGRYKLLEVNPRLWQWHSLAAACGVDLPWIAYRDLIGDPLPPARMHGDGKRWAITLMAGSGHAIERPPYVDAVFARDDPKPALVQIGRHAVRGVRTLTGATSVAEITPHPRRRRREVAPLRPLGDPPRGARPRGARRVRPRQPARGRARRPRRPPVPGSRPAAASVPLVRRFRMAPALAGLAERVQPDVVHSHYLLPVRLLDGARRARAARRQPVGEGRDRRRLAARPRARSARGSAIAPDRALAYVVNSQALEDAVGPARRRPRKVPPHLLARAHRRLLARARRPQPLDATLGWPDDAVVCLSLRNFRPYSNLDVVLRAFAKARQEVPRAAALLERRRRLDPRRVRPARGGARGRAVHGRAGRARGGAARP